MDNLPIGEERRLYEISYTFPASSGIEAEEEHIAKELRDMIEKQGGIVQDAPQSKSYRNLLRGCMHIIAPPSLTARIEAAIRTCTSPALKRALLVRWKKTSKSRRHAFMRKPILQQEQQEEEQRANEIDRQLDEVLEKQL